MFAVDYRRRPIQNPERQDALESTLGPELSLLNSLLPEAGIELDVASWPNPFYGVAPATFIASDQMDLSLVDGGEDGQVIPLQPLLVKARGLDTILAIDAVSGVLGAGDCDSCHALQTSDIDNFADGSSLIVSPHCGWRTRTDGFPGDTRPDHVAVAGVHVPSRPHVRRRFRCTESEYAANVFWVQRDERQRQHAARGIPRQRRSAS